MKKLLAVVLALTMVLGMVSFASAEGEQEIVWMFWDDLDATTDLISLGYKQVVERFNTDYAGKYHVTVVTTNLEEYDAKVQAYYAANGKMPDVWICNPGPNMNVYVDAGLAMPLNDILDADPAWRDSFTGGIFERMTYNGQIMAVPTNFAAACCFYNTEMFAAAGVEVPTTFEELLAACEKLQAAGYQPITCSAGTPWCLSMVAGYLMDRCGGPDNLQKVATGETTWLDDSFVKGAELLVQLSKYFQPTASSDTNDECVAQFYNEKAAILIQGSWVIAQVNGANADFENKCGVFQFPAVTGGSDPNRMIVKTDNLLVSKDTASVEACVALLKYFTDDTAQAYTAEVGGKIPVTSVTVDYSKAPKQLSYVMNILSGMTGSLGFYNESLANVEAGDVFDNAMVAIVLGQKTVEEGLKAVNQYYEEEVW